MGHNLFVTDRFEDKSHGLRQLTKCDDAFIISQVQIKGDAFGHVIGQPPAGITSFVGCAVDRCVQPVAIEFEQLPGICAEIRKFFFKRDHDSY
jgi:hypothetical protein